MIYSIIKKLEISASHQLSLSYESKCGRLHGHNWTITVYLASTSLNEDGMVADFTHVKRAIHGYLDHGNLNELLSFNPTAENLAAWVISQFPECYKAVVEESSGNTAQAVDEQFPIDLKFLAL